jgi:flagellar basal-body rod protein FlgF
MDTTSYLALSRQVALQRHMTTIATNLANAGTTGYRAEHTVFEGLLQRVGAPGRVAFVQDVALTRDLSPGAVEQTGNPLDLALDGDGYLSFQTPAGTRYGRAGRLALDTDGRLVNAQGHPLLDVGGSPITLPANDHDISVGADGTIAGSDGPIARVGIVAFTREQAMDRIGDGLLATSEPPVPATRTRVVQGALEGSNVQPVTELTTMMDTVRAFEGTQRMIETEHELQRQAIERIVRAAA